MNHVSKPAYTNDSQDLILKTPNTKRAGGVAQGVGPEFKPWHYKKKKLNPIKITADFSTETLKVRQAWSKVF
jgi:hypothetical protein